MHRKLKRERKIVNGVCISLMEGILLRQVLSSVDVSDAFFKEWTNLTYSSEIGDKIGY